MMHTEMIIWPTLVMALVLAGIAGCIVTAIFANVLAGVPIAAVAGKPGKHLWSIIFAIPVPVIMGWGLPSGILLAFLWLVFAPTAASKLYFGPKQAPWVTLFAFHSGYALAVLAVYFLVLRLAI